MVANIFCNATCRKKHEFSYLKLENSRLIFRSALPRLQLCYGDSTYLPPRHTREIRFYRLTDALRVAALDYRCPARAESTGIARRSIVIRKKQRKP
jgi:hypothetical protein